MVSSLVSVVVDLLPTPERGGGMFAKKKERGAGHEQFVCMGDDGECSKLFTSLKGGEKPFSLGSIAAHRKRLKDRRSGAIRSGACELDKTQVPT